jgi:glyoxylase-like metal-dependent hydrolase (beta-lactamase superfamily II)
LSGCEAWRVTEHTEHDVRFRDLEGALVCHRFGDVLVDPGPASTLDALLALLPEGFEPRAIAATHVHLDHFGACGVLARRFPAAEVWVSEPGAPHVVDPSRLVASATRLYGARMDELWGPVVPVPADRVRIVRDGDRLDGGFVVAATPGHAKHHVAYLHEPTGVVGAGDVAGVRVGGHGVCAPTPPPDVDVEAWEASVERLRAWRPRALAVTHAGTHADVDAHLDALLADLREQLRLASQLDPAAFLAQAEARTGGDPVLRAAMPPENQHAGLARYLAGRAAHADRTPL